ncbi:hypothetical protein SAMN02745171_01350 [Porphyromonas circumdentaria]|uniref:Uncharacterized protein n=1 Tax=Porphyromonas circumdentaria TaxID=29524 RepID=A0A1T4P6N5_9PORP|nr:hypothetical protein [Porphyromonas circumdentaria]SJZ87119.1 hypothetical protein SAMN02745171_01350 [Porphyromonas circumdentaria]
MALLTLCYILFCRDLFRPFPLGRIEEIGASAINISKNLIFAKVKHLVKYIGNNNKETL